MGLYANLADYRVRVAVIRVRISAAPLKSRVIAPCSKPWAHLFNL